LKIAFWQMCIMHLTESIFQTGFKILFPGALGFASRFEEQIMDAIKKDKPKIDLPLYFV